MWWIGACAAALAQTVEETEVFAEDDIPTKRVLVRREPPDLRPLRNGPSFGFSAGMATGFGPTIGIPTGQWGRIQLTFLPFVIDGGFGGSGGLRFKQFLGRNPRSRLYVVEGVGISGWQNEGSIWGAGVGMGVETRKEATSGRTGWFDVTVTALGTNQSQRLLILPLPQAGVAWIF